MAKPAVAKESWEDAIRRGVDSVRERWPESTGPVSLADAHRLLDDSAIGEAVIRATIDFGYSLSGTIGAARGSDGKLLVPFPEKLLTNLRGQVLAALCDGWLIARGLKPSDAMCGKPVNITADRWSILEPDFKLSAATCHGLTVVVGITVTACNALDDRQSAPPISAAELHEWFDRQNLKNQRQACEAAKTEFGKRVARERVRDLWRTRGRRTRPGRPPKK